MSDEFLELVQFEGMPPLVFGLDLASVLRVVSEWGEARELPETPSGTRRFHVQDNLHGLDLYPTFEGVNSLTSIEVWRPDGSYGDGSMCRIRFMEVDLFRLRASDVIKRLSALGFAGDLSDPYFPVYDQIALGFNRSGGDDCDDEGMSLHFRSVLIGPPGYYGTGV